MFGVTGRHMSNDMRELSTMHSSPLADGEVHLWHVFSDAVTDPKLLKRYCELLSEDELQRQQRFVFARDRHQFLVTRALVRAVLSSYTGHDPRAWVFGQNAYGKPEIALPAGVALRFNLAHTTGLVTCAVAAGGDLGVDVEDLQHGRQGLDLARQYFATAEVAALEQWPAEEQPTGFFQFWTLKEAYIKARGMGLSIPLGEFAFRLAADRPPEITFAAGRPEHGAGWQFARIRLGGRYQIAVAVRWPQSARLRIQWRETVPLHRAGVSRLLPHNPGNEWFL
jgi:4'-phosphopantetheinyl transferase